MRREQTDFLDVMDTDLSRKSLSSQLRGVGSAGGSPHPATVRARVLRAKLRTILLELSVGAPELPVGVSQGTFRTALQLDLHDLIS